MPSCARTRYDSQLTSVVLLELQLRLRLSDQERRRVFVFRYFFVCFENALLEREKMVNPRSRGKHPKVIFSFQLHSRPCLGVCWQLTSFMSWPVSLLRFSGMPQNRSPQHRRHCHLRSVRLSIRVVRIRFRESRNMKASRIVWPEYGRERFQV